MLLLLASVSPYYAYHQSDWFGRSIVLLLLGMSVFSWTIIVDKWLLLRQLRRQLDAFMAFYRSQAGLAEVLRGFDGYDGPPRHIIHDALLTLGKVHSGNGEQFLRDLQAGGPTPVLNDPQWEHLRTAMVQATDRELMALEERLSLLSTIVSASPFLGLLGTVWGVMMAFCGMSLSGRADLQALTPGVSGALLTTAVGLLVAIPSIICYNALVAQVKTITIRLDHFTEELYNVIKSQWTAPVREPPR